MSEAIPKVLFTYWAGESISYLHLMALRTACHFHRDYRIILYTDKNAQSSQEISYLSHEHKLEMKKPYPFRMLKSMDIGFEVVEVDFEKEYGIKGSLFHTYFADILRIKKLEEHGGVWFDMDVLFLNRLKGYFTNPLPQGKSAVVFSYSDTIATGLVGALPKAPTIIKMSRLADTYIKLGVQENFEGQAKIHDFYQAFGPDLWRKVHHPYLDERADQHPEACAVHVPEVYPYLWNEIHNYFDGPRSSDHTYEIIGIHWYNGSTDARVFINEKLSQMDLEAPKTPIEQDLAYLRDRGVDVSIPKIASLKGASLRGVTMTDSNFAFADMKNADLTNSDLRNSCFDYADLRGAVFENANLEGASFVGALGMITETTMSTSTERCEVVKQNDTQQVGVSIVMTSFNRKPQLVKTLSTFEKSRHENFEVIVIEDGSDEPHKLSRSELEAFTFKLKYVEIPKSEKDWINPSKAYNLGIQYATKEVVILQNAEVAHVGDCISFAAKHTTPKSWVSFNCYGLARTSKIDVSTQSFEDIQKQVQALPQNIGGNSVAVDDPSGWLNHYDLHFTAYHYCAAVMRADLEAHLEGGFNPLFENLVGGDDDELIKRLIYKGFTFKTTKFPNAHPFVIHQFHEKSESVRQWDASIFKKTLLAFSECCIRMGMAPENNIALAPKEETPKYYQYLIEEV